MQRRAGGRRRGKTKRKGQSERVMKERKRGRMSEEEAFLCHFLGRYDQIE